MQFPCLLGSQEHLTTSLKAACLEKACGWYRSLEGHQEGCLTEQHLLAGLMHFIICFVFFDRTNHQRRGATSMYTYSHILAHTCTSTSAQRHLYRSMSVNRCILNARTHILIHIHICPQTHVYMDMSETWVAPPYVCHCIFLPEAGRRADHWR